MKKLFILAIILGGLYYFGAHTAPGKQQYRKLSNWVSDKVDETVSKTSIGDESTTVYKVQNPDGSWSFTNEKPVNPNQVVEEKQYQNNTNVLPSVSPSISTEDKK